MDCLHFFYTSQAKYVMNENDLYLTDSLALFFEQFFCRRSKILEVTLCLFKIRTFNQTT